MQNITILHLEDTNSDAEFIARHIERNSRGCTIILVKNEYDYTEALDRGGFDIILSDYRLESFDGDQALKLAREQRPDTPFIMVTGELGEDRAVETLKRGAWDYVLKDNLKRLIPAIERALKDAQRAREHREVAQRLQHEEQELRNSREHLRLIFESATEYAIFTTDLHGKITAWNTGAERLLGYTEEEAIGMNVAALFTPEDNAEGVPETEMKQALNEGRGLDDRWQVRKNSSRFFASGFTFPLRAHNSHATGFLKIMRDRTSDRLARDAADERREAVRRTEEMYELALEAVHQGVWVWDPGTKQGHVTRLTQIIMGLPPGESHPAFEDYMNIVHPEDELRVRTDFEDAFQGRKPLGTEYRIVHPDGTVRWIHSAGRIVRMNDRSQGFVGITQDITSQKQNEQSLRYFEAIIQSSDDAIIGKDLEGTITSWNAAAERIFGYTAREIVGKSIRKIIPPEKHEEESAIIDQIKNNRAIDHFDTTRMAKDGHLVEVSLSISPIKDSTGAIVGASSIARDVTQRKRHEREIRQLNEHLEQRVLERTAELEATNKDLEAFSYSISHDLRAPLRLIAGYSTSIRQEYAPQLDEEALRRLRLITSSTVDLGNLVEAMLEFSRLGQKGMIRSSVDMKALTLGIVQQQNEIRPGVKVIIGDLPTVPGDATLLRQAVTNLISNSYKFTRNVENPTVEIGYRLDENASIFYVRDNGIGFDMKYVDKLFSPFQRLHYEKSFEGTGVGLVLAKRIIERHGGRIWAEAEAGKGATFYFTLSER